MTSNQTKTSEKKDKKSLPVSAISALLGILLIQGEILLQYVSIAWIVLLPSLLLSEVLSLIGIQYGLSYAPSFLIVWMSMTFFVGVRK